MKSFLILVLASAGLASVSAVKVAKSYPAGPLSISERGLDLIVDAETGGRGYYEKRLETPTWPGGASGVTIGIGYDVGYNTRTQILSDWSGLPVAQREALASAAGITGQEARLRAPGLRWITVPWASAQDVFVASTMPRFGKLTEGAFPGIKAEAGHAQGALLSLVFNRGSSLSGDSRREMRAIRDDLSSGRSRDVPAQIRAMKRLWVGKGLDGLLTRRENEARLYELSFSPN